MAEILILYLSRSLTLQYISVDLSCCLPIPESDLARRWTINISAKTERVEDHILLSCHEGRLENCSLGFSVLLLFFAFEPGRVEVEMNRISRTLQEQFSTMVKVDYTVINLYFQIFRSVCVASVQEEIVNMGGPGKDVEIGIISLGTVSEDGKKRQVSTTIFHHLSAVCLNQSTYPKCHPC